MTNELQTILDEIVIDKETNLIPKNIKKGVTTLGVKGTFEGGGGKGEVMLFPTIEEMNANPGQLDDLGIVYNEIVANMSVDSIIQIVNFPEVVVLPETAPDNINVYLEPVEGGWFDFWGGVQKTSASFSAYTETGEISVTYTSTDGKTYTRTGDKTNPVDFGQKLRWREINKNDWNDLLGYFFQIDTVIFTGLFEYTHYDLSNHFTINDVEYAFPEEIVNVLRGQDFITLVALEYEEKEGIQYVTKAVGCKTQNSPFVGIIKALDSGLFYPLIPHTYTVTVYEYSLTTGLVVNEYENSTSASAFPTVVSSSFASGTKAEWASENLVAVTHLGYNDDRVGTIPSLGGAFTSKPDLFISKEHGLDKWSAAPTQFSADKSDLFPGKVALGKNGAIKGDGSIWSKIPEADFYKDIVNISDIDNNKISVYKERGPYLFSEQATLAKLLYFKEDKQSDKFINCFKNVAYKKQQVANTSSDWIYSDDTYYYMKYRASTTIMGFFRINKETNEINDIVVTLPNQLNANSWTMYKGDIYIFGYGTATGVIYCYKVNVSTGAISQIYNTSFTNPYSVRTMFCYVDEENDKLVFGMHYWTNSSGAGVVRCYSYDGATVTTLRNGTSWATFTGTVTRVGNYLVGVYNPNMYVFPLVSGSAFTKTPLKMGDYLCTQGYGGIHNGILYYSMKYSSPIVLYGINLSTQAQVETPIQFPNASSAHSYFTIKEGKFFYQSYTRDIYVYDMSDLTKPVYFMKSLSDQPLEGEAGLQGRVYHSTATFYEYDGKELTLVICSSQSNIQGISKFTSKNVKIYNALIWGSDPDLIVATIAKNNRLISLKDSLFFKETSGGPISQKEFDDALNLAQDILGGEV